MSLQPDIDGAVVLPAEIAEAPRTKPAGRPIWAFLLMPGAFRLLLASAVVVNHYTKLQIGTAAVELFFILSGYWIDRMYGKQYAELRASAFVFIVSRFMRLMPLFLPFSIAAIALQLALHEKAAPDHLGVGLLPNFIILGYASMAERPLVPAWSLDIELQFYLLFPIFWVLLERSRAAIAGLTVVLLAAGGWYLGFYLHDQSANVLPYLGFFAIGVSASRLSWKPPAWLIWLGGAAAIAIILSALAVPTARGLLIAVDGLPGRDFNTAANIALALCLAPFAIFTVTQRSTRTDRTIGDLSYAVYCAHWLGVVLAAHYLAGAGMGTKLPYIAVLIVLTYLAGLALLLWFDRPIGRLREAWIHRQPVRGATPETDAATAV